MFNSIALTKIQSIILAVVIVCATLGGGASYVLLTGQEQTSDTIKIGVCADLDMPAGKAAWEGAVLAAEQINAEGGILGRDIEVIGEDNDDQIRPIDVTKISTACTRLITLHNVDFLIGAVGSSEAGIVMQDIAAEHKKIFFAVRTGADELTQRVVDDYEKYKYLFRVYSGNSTGAILGMTDFILTIREYSGLNKVGMLIEEISSLEHTAAEIEKILPENGFEIVYKDVFVPGSFEFSSYFSAIEAAGTEFLIPFIVTSSGIPFVKEWYDRQSPCINAGINSYAKNDGFWEETEGKCEHTVANALPVTAGYPLTNKTLPMREDYIQRWGSTPISAAVSTYDTMRFILFEALERAGTTQTDRVIEELERTSVETTMAKVFEFTSDHDVLVGADPNDPEKQYMVMLMFQWQSDKKLVPVYPRNIMEEAGATYTFPDWPGPWD